MCTLATVVIFWSEAFCCNSIPILICWVSQKMGNSSSFYSKKEKEQSFWIHMLCHFFSFTIFNHGIPNFNNFGIGLDILYHLVLLLQWLPSNLTFSHLCSTELVCLFLKLVFCSCYPIGFGTRGFLCEDIDIKQASAIERPFLWNGIALWQYFTALPFLNHSVGYMNYNIVACWFSCQCYMVRMYSGPLKVWDSTVWFLLVSMLYGFYVMFF